jgi:hypothetical protein
MSGTHSPASDSSIYTHKISGVMLPDGSPEEAGCL